MRIVGRMAFGLFLAAVVFAAVAGAGEVIERYDDGLVKVKYIADQQGQKCGAYLEYYPKGKIKLQCCYKAGQLDGSYTSYYEAGGQHIKACYTDGQLNGPYLEQDEKGRILKEQIFWKGRLLYPRSIRLIANTLAEIGVKPGGNDAGRGSTVGRGSTTGKGSTVGKGSTTGKARPGDKSGDRPGEKPADTAAKVAPEPPKSDGGLAALTDPVNVETLKRLNAYRFLVGVPWDVTLKAEYCERGMYGANCVALLGRLSHNPPNPGWPAEEYKKALEGTTNGNLAQGRGTRTSVDMYMDDSDPGNISVVGHRRWCLNPAMLYAGFGESGSFSCMYAHDRSRKETVDYDFVAFPAAGFMPSGFFSAEHAWSVSVNPRKYRQPAKSAVKVNLYQLLPASDGGLDPTRRGQPLELNFFNVDLGGCGINNAIIFRPKELSLRGSATRYWVEITGLKKADGSDTTIEYLVEFCQL